MDSNKEMQELITSVHIPMIFYIPSKVLEVTNLEVTKEMTMHPMFNTLLMMKENGEGSEYREGLDSLEIYKKEKVFNANIYKLLEIKARNNEDAFKFLIEKYVSQVRGYHDAFLWMCDNVEQDVVEVSQAAKDNLEFQKSITALHLDELEMRFPNVQVTTSASIQSLLTNTNFITNKSEESSSENHTFGTPLVEQQDHNKKPKKREKLVLATVEEVDEFLLTTVFNVKTAQKTTTKQK